jgi:translation initiation factor IF-1
MTTRKVTGDVVVMNILTGLLKLRDENGNEHKIRAAGKLLSGINPGDKVEVEIRKSKTSLVKKLAEIKSTSCV